MISLTSPVRTRAHTWPAGIKLGLLCLATTGLFFVGSPWVHMALLTTILMLYAAPGWQFFSYGLCRLLVLWPFVLIVCLWHMYSGTYFEGSIILMRLVSTVALANLVTMTTHLSDMIGVIRVLLVPFRRLGFNSRALEIAIALVVRMTPVLLHKGAAVTESWQARSSRWVNWKVIVPFTLLVLDDADHVADALKARGGLLTPE